MSPSERLGRYPSLLAPGLHLVALTALVVAEPLFGVLQSNPEFFVAHRTAQASCRGPITAAGIAEALALQQLSA
jgi:hypothetical protein